ncbi:MAG TPA: sigma-70 family RNA polymerase sigma factor [Kofleriaceae bacterium]|nr:sigma-70 family RNA polymerase sigma factor [Kofleriaceae bacterium]
MAGTQMEQTSTSWDAEPSDEHLVKLMAAHAAPANDGATPDSAAADALSELYRRYGGLLLGLAMRILRSSAEAEDLVHDVFLEAWKNAAGYDPQRASVRTWLTVRMRSRALDVIKSARVSRNAGADPLLALVEQPITATDVHANSHLHEGLAGLSHEHRVTLEAAYFDGLTCAEIAARDGVPLGTVKSRTANALAKLRVVFAEKGGAGGDE